MELILQGIGVSPGVAIGPTVTFHLDALEPSQYTVEDPEAEVARLNDAIERSRAGLVRLRERVTADLGEQHAAIFDTHLALLDDPALGPETERRIREERLNAEYLVAEILKAYADMVDQIDDPLFRERSTDLLDVGRRILHNLSQGEVESLEHLEHPSVIVANELTPSETVNMDMKNTLALATDGGGPTSHMAILARAFQLPCVVAVSDLAANARPGDTVIVDGRAGRVIVRPTPESLERYEAKRKQEEEDQLRLVAAEVEGPATTLDGHEVPTLANLELLKETEQSLRGHCQGVGLYRTEYLFLNRPALPDEEEQFENYKAIVDRMAPLPVTIRTLDVGGDKLVPELHREHEVNPQLGWRSIRVCLDRPDIFKTQLRALFRASVAGNMSIMFPMISSVDQFRAAKQHAEETKAELRAEGVPFDESVKVGCMIEVPAAVGAAPMLAAESDFFSVGSNDLIQYALAVDRVNKRTASLYDPVHPGILRLLAYTVSAAQEAKIPCTICGEMAGDPLLTEVLVGLGFDHLSMTAIALPQVRSIISHIRYEDAKALARKVTDMGSESEIRALLSKRSAEVMAAASAEYTAR